MGSHANPHFGNTNGVTGAWLKQDLVVRVGTLFGHQPDAKTISYSEDGGRHWTMCATVPTEKSRNGHIAVAADGSSWIWIPDRSKAYLTRDKGASWQVCRGLPKNIRVIADKVNPKRFYAVDAVAEILYSSEDGGATFHADTLNLTVKRSQRGNAGAAVRRGDLRGGQDRIYATPGREKICGLQLMMVCTTLSLQKNLISVFWIRYVPSMLLASARQSRVMIILPSI